MRLIAHRGDSHSAPENTLAAFHQALNAGATLLECDVQRTREGQLVVLHDGTLNRTTTGRGAVSSKTLAELRRFSAGYAKKFGSEFAAERIPTLEQLLSRIDRRAHLYVELKGEALTPEEDELRKALQVARACDAVADVTFISFEWTAIEAIRELEPGIQLGLLFDRYRPQPIFALAEKIRATILLGRVDLVEAHPDFILEAHRRGIRVGVYTVDSLDRLKQLEQIGVDEAATNRVSDFIRHFPDPPPRGGAK